MKNAVVLFFYLVTLPLYSLNFEGSLQEVQISQLHRASDGNEERIAEKKYALLLTKPITALLPTGSFEEVFFVLLEKRDEFIPFINKHVIIEGEFAEMAAPLFANIAILRVDQIVEDTLLNMHELSEETYCFLEELIPVVARAAVNLARWRALASGFKVLEVEDGQLIEVSPDGTKTWIRSLQ